MKLSAGPGPSIN